MNGKYLAGAIAGSPAAGLGITGMMMAGEKKSGTPSELIDLKRASAAMLDAETPNGGLPTATEQVVAQKGHLLLSALAGTSYAAVTDENNDPLVGGVPFGLFFDALAHWLAGPLLGVKPPEWTQGGETIGMHTANHVASGLATAFSAHAAART